MTWAEKWIRLTQLDPTAENLPDTYQTSALRMILCGNIKTHVDLKFSRPGPEPSMTELRGEIRRYAGIKRSEIWATQGRHAMEVDAVSPKEGDHGVTHTPYMAPFEWNTGNVGPPRNNWAGE